MREIVISMNSYAATLNLNERGEFTIAFATARTLTTYDYVGIVSAMKEPNKIERTGWNLIPAEKNATVFTNFPMTLECKINLSINLLHGENTPGHIMKWVNKNRT